LQLGGTRSAKPPSGHGMTSVVQGLGSAEHSGNSQQGGLRAT
jgi:hypothetical protein